MGLLWLSYQRAEETRHWPSVPGIIVLAQVLSERPSPNSPVFHRAEIRYRYDFAGKSYTGSHVKRVEGPSAERGKADAIVKKYTPGMAVTCFVKPEDASFAVLEHSSRAGLYSIWFPFLFVAGGAGIAWSAFREKKPVAA